MKPSSIYFIYLSVFFFGFFSATALPAQVFTPRQEEMLIGKAFYLLRVLSKDKKLREILERDEVLANLSSQKLNNIQAALQECATTDCLGEAVKWKETEMEQTENALVKLYKRHNSTFIKLVQELKTNGTYRLYGSMTDTVFIQKVWNLTARGMNHIAGVYLQAEKPLYPRIDSISYRADDPYFKEGVWASGKKSIATLKNKKALFFELPLQLMLSALKINGRNEATRYEPLTRGMNRKPFKAVTKTDWKEYRYSVILVPGQGPEDPEIVLDPIAKERMKLAVRYYNDKAAPFIIVSGGNVHPYKTRFNEAVEMKKYMVDSLKLPKWAVIIEPHARHTTTNIRNTSRILLRFNIPFQMPVLITTTSAQNNYIHTKLRTRAQDELGYLLYKDLKKISDEVSEFYPVISVQQGNPFDILDP